MKKLKRFCTVFLSVLLITSMLPLQVFAEFSGRVDLGASDQVDTGDAADGDVTTGGYWINQPAVFVSAVLVPANNVSEAETFIQTNCGSPNPSFYDAAISGAMFTSTSALNGELNSNNCSSELIHILCSFCGTRDTNRFWASEAYEQYWHELINVLYSVGHCPSSVYQFYQQYGTTDGHGNKIVIVFELGYVSYYQDTNNVNHTENLIKGTYGQHLGPDYGRPFTNMDNARTTFMNLHNNGSIDVKANLGDTYEELAYGLNVSGGACSLSNGSTPNGRALMFTNYISSSAGNYYGRGYWMPGIGGPVIISSVTCDFEVSSTPQKGHEDLGDGNYEVGSFLFKFAADETTIDTIRNSSGTYTVKITTHDTDTGAIIPNTESSNPVTWFNLGVRPGDELRTVTVNNSTANHSISSGGVLKFKVTPESLATMLEGGYEPIMACRVKDTVQEGKESLYYTARFSVEITHSSNSNLNMVGVPADIPDYGTGHLNSPGHYDCEVVWWEDSSEKEIPWEFHSDNNPVAFAEVVGNQAGYLSNSGAGVLDRHAQDWNVNAGIPSTENLSVVAGGQTYLFDLAGLIKTYGESYSGTVDNTGIGTNVSGIATRDINFNVVIEDWWGADNTPCSLSCPGHTATGGNEAQASTSDGTAVTSARCRYCGNTVTAQGQNARPPSGTPGTPGYDAGAPAVGDSKSCGCSYTLTYYCSSDSATCDGASISKSTTLYNNQRYGGTVTATCPGGATLSVSTDSGLLCDGYTSNKGCVHSNNHNCAHRQSKTISFSIKETIDTYAYRSITQARVYALTDAEITAVNTAVVENSAIGRSVSNSNLYLYLWRGDGAYNKKGETGRLWFTQFKNPNYNGGWVSTTVYNSETKDTTNLGYWLGDCTITLRVKADSLAANAANPSALDDAPSLLTHRGKALNNYGSVTSSSTAYQSNAGDKLSDAQCVSLAQHVANAWQYYNDTKYTVIVISDTLAAGTSQGGVSVTGNNQDTFQTIVGDAYAVDNGIYLFNYGFTASGEVHYRTHKSKYSDANVAGMILTNTFSVRDVTENNLTNAQTGYIGIPSDNPIIKYGTSAMSYSGSTIDAIQSSGAIVTTPMVRRRNNTLAGFLEYTSEGNHNDGTDNATSPNSVLLWSAGTIQTTTSGAPYGTLVSTDFKNLAGAKVKAGQLSADLVTTGTCAYQTFEGYYNTHTYPNIQSAAGSITAQGRINGNYSNPTFTVNVTDHGNRNMHQSYTANGFTNYYNAAMVISNIDMKDKAYNGVYTEPVTVKANYRNMFKLVTNDSVANLVQERTNISSKAIYKSGDSGVNSIIIQDPVSVQYCAIIGNGAGDYASGVEDETGHDMRSFNNAYVESDGSLTEEESDLKQERLKNNYIVMGNTFHLWFSDFGDFYDSGGLWSITSISNKRGVGCSSDAFDSMTGDKEIVAGKPISSAEGYSNNMLCSEWTDKRYVAFSFPVSYVNTEGKTILVPIGLKVDLDDVRCLKSNGTTGTTSVSNMKTPSDELLQFVDDCPTLQDDSVKYGLDYEFTCLTSTSESRTAKVFVESVAINAPSSYNGTEPTNATRGGYVAEHSAQAMYDVEIVGRIGNLALEDVGDFRFSNLFKKANDTWLIDQVIHGVNADEPNTILSTRYDLLLNNAVEVGINHNTTSVNAVSKGSNAFLGKAGDWLPLPLTASLNNVEEFRTEQMRLGYQAFFDIETMGNYYGVNLDDAGVTYLGPQSIEDSKNTSDDRQYKMVITPHYVLYDYVNGTYHDIDLYAGKQGAWERYWTDGLYLTEEVAGIYTNVNENKERWNVGTYEPYASSIITGEKGTSAFSGEDFIGTASQIVLDQANRSFIGSSTMYGSLTKVNNTLKIVPGSRTVYLYDNQKSSYNGEYDPQAQYSNSRLVEKDYLQQTQRWYFALGLPSSTYVVPAGVSPDNQMEIENQHEQLKAAHPNSVVLCYATIEVTGKVWELTYNFENENGTCEITLFKSQDDIPTSVTNPNAVNMKFDPTKDPTSGIEEYMAPLLIMDAWNTSADDWDTYGTH